MEVEKGKLEHILIFLVSGIWHGASWTFILWGISHGLACVFERIFDKFLSKIPAVIRRIMTFIFISITWVFFRAENWSQIVNVFKGLFNFSNIGIAQIGNLANDGIFSFPTILNVAYVVIILVILLFIVFKCKNSNEKYEEMKLNNWNLAFYIIIFIVSVIHLNKVGTFIYFNF